MKRTGDEAHRYYKGHDIPPKTAFRKQQSEKSGHNSQERRPAFSVLLLLYHG